MSWLLRHGAEKSGLSIRPDGYVPYDQVLNCQKFRNWKVTDEFIRSVVENNDKKRFEMMTENNQTFIRATQGHSMAIIETESLLQPITNPFEFTQVIHGTYLEPLPLIMKGGLNRMGRKHVHMAIDTIGKEGVVSGMRGSCQVVIEVNMTKAIHGPHKIPFFISSNKVILTEGL